MNIGEDKYHELKCIWFKNDGTKEEEEVRGFLEIDHGSLRFADSTKKFLFLEANVSWIEIKSGFIMVSGYSPAEIYDKEGKEINNIFKRDTYTFEPKEWCL